MENDLLRHVLSLIHTYKCKNWVAPSLVKKKKGKWRREGEGFTESLLWLELNQALSHKLPCWRLAQGNRQPGGILELGLCCQSRCPERHAPAQDASSDLLVSPSHRTHSDTPSIPATADGSPNQLDTLKLLAGIHLKEIKSGSVYLHK